MRRFQPYHGKGQPSQTVAGPTTPTPIPKFKRQLPKPLPRVQPKHGEGEPIDNRSAVQPKHGQGQPPRPVPSQKLTNKFFWPKPKNSGIQRPLPRPTKKVQPEHGEDERPRPDDDSGSAGSSGVQPEHGKGQASEHVAESAEPDIQPEHGEDERSRSGRIMVVPPNEFRAVSDWVRTWLQAGTCATPPRPDDNRSGSSGVQPGHGEGEPPRPDGNPEHGKGPPSERHPRNPRLRRAPAKAAPKYAVYGSVSSSVPLPTPAELPPKYGGQGKGPPIRQSLRPVPYFLLERGRPSDAFRRTPPPRQPVHRQPEHGQGQNPSGKRPAPPDAEVGPATRRRSR